ncbi:hypothetical protein MMC10_001303 [Thelotrema lepadinum]|nr:hypothetical protein [Thelotrema lepadinum]
MAMEEKTYQPKDAIAAATQASLITGGAGLFMSAVQSSLSRQNLGLLGVFTRTGGHAAVFARTLPAVLGYGALFSVILSAFDYSGGALQGSKKDSKEDEFERKERLRKNRRRPIQETIDELGEGRGNFSIPNIIICLLTDLGIYGPGYEERRRERIKQAYGIDVGAKEA